MLKLLAFVLPLAVDSFAIAALLGASGVTRPSDGEQDAASRLASAHGLAPLGLGNLPADRSNYPALNLGAFFAA